MSDDLLGGTSSRDVGRGGVLLPEGFYPELRLVKAEVFRQSLGAKPRTFSCDVEVLVSENGTPAGTYGSGPFEQLESSGFDSYDKESRARTMVLLGALFGYGKPDQIDANINGQTLTLVTSDAQPMTGTVFSARVTHKQTKKGKTIQKFTEVGPVIDPATGKPKVVRGKVAGVAAPVSAPVSAPVTAPAAFVPPPPPVAAPAAPALPAGWAPHPQAPTWIYELANPSNMKQTG
jgi:hypothetical protein